MAVVIWLILFKIRVLFCECCNNKLQTFARLPCRVFWSGAKKKWQYIGVFFSSAGPDDDLSETAFGYIRKTVDAQVKAGSRRVVGILIELFHVSNEHPHLLSHGRLGEQRLRDLDKYVKNLIVEYVQVELIQRKLQDVVVRKTAFC